MIIPVRLVKEILDKVQTTTGIVYWAILIMEMKLIVLHALLNVWHAQILYHAFLVEEILDKLYQIIATVKLDIMIKEI